MPPFGKSMTDYKQKYIELRKALTALKRGKPSTQDLEILGCDIDEFDTANEYMIALNIEVEERRQFVKLLKKHNITFVDIPVIKRTSEELEAIGQHLQYVRNRIEIEPDNGDLLEIERILGNIKWNNGETV